MSDFTWTHDNLQGDLFRKRKGRKATVAWSEIEIPGTKGGRFDVFEARYHDAKAQTTFVGFEVKASRGDLESDLETGKWKRYLPASDQFYFALPKDLCDASEIPEPAGILWQTGGRAGRWRVGRQPGGGHRTTTDIDIWRRLALREYWTPTTVTKTRQERIEEYNRAEKLRYHIASRVWAEIDEERRALWQDRLKYENVERKIEQLEELERRLDGIPDLLGAIQSLVSFAGRKAGVRQFPAMTVAQAIGVLEES